MGASLLAKVSSRAIGNDLREQARSHRGAKHCGATLVVYMGVAKLSEIREQLLAGGMAADMPVAMIENASLPHQRECRSLLSAMEHDAEAFQLKSPAILVIGRVAAHAQQHLWEQDLCGSEPARESIKSSYR